MNYIYLTILCIFLMILFNKRLAGSDIWRATITPLASIIGSGFLIAAPILNSLNSSNAVLMMLILCLLSFSIGMVIRWNIMEVEGRSESFLSEKLSDIFLSLAYILSVTYYLYLLSSFILKATGLHTLNLEKSIASIFICSIGYYGHQYGFKSLEKIEQISVNIKLAIIATFLCALGYFNFHNTIPDVEGTQMDFHSFRILLGLVIMVQGFETSRYLGNSYSKEVRVKSMRNAQIVSTIIYLLFIILFSGVFILHPISGKVEETSVIDSAKYVFQLGPLLLLIAALASQLSAALADVSGCGGLVDEFTRGKISEKRSYLLLALLSVILIWSFNIFEIISLASKGFALYYLLQCLSSIRYFFYRSKIKFLFSSFMAIACILIVILGISFE